MTGGFPGSALKLASSLEERTKRVTLAGTIPALVAHPDWRTPAPLVLWMHGRTSRKEIDSGRYLRLIRAGIGVCAIDLPGHGDRADESLQSAAGTVEMLALAQPEVDVAIEALLDGEHGGVFDRGRLGIGGISAGGMVTLRRLCEPHGFVCASVEATSGWLHGLYFPEDGGQTRWPVDHARDAVEAIDPMAHLEGFEPLPLQALHSEADELVPFAVQVRFIDRLREHYRAKAADPAMIELATWPRTGAPQEHLGFGRVSNEAKNLQVGFFTRHLLGGAE
jgi:alpha-beta hydrolase superfamily lysophospholipase